MHHGKWQMGSKLINSFRNSIAAQSKIITIFDHSRHRQRSLHNSYSESTSSYYGPTIRLLIDCVICVIHR